MAVEVQAGFGEFAPTVSASAHLGQSRGQSKCTDCPLCPLQIGRDDGIVFRVLHVFAQCFRLLVCQFTPAGTE